MTFFLWPTVLVLTRFLREKRLSNAQGRGLCEANAGHAPRAMVIWGRGIVGDAIKSWCDRPDDRFWSVSHIRRRYTKPVFTGFPLQLYGYRTVPADLYLRAFPGSFLEFWLSVLSLDSVVSARFRIRWLSPYKIYRIRCIYTHFVVYTVHLSNNIVWFTKQILVQYHSVSIFFNVTITVKNIPPGPIFYYGGLYGEIRTHTKYNTTLVTCDRFSTSSAAPRKNRDFSRRRIFAGLFLGWHA